MAKSDGIWWEMLETSAPVFGQRRLGRHIEHDERSRKYPFYAPRYEALRPVRWTSYISVLDQGPLGACTGYASVACLGKDPYFHTLNDLVLSRELAQDIYGMATRIDSFPGEWPPTDTGSSGLAVAKVLKREGIISGYQHIFHFEDLLSALQQGPLIVGTSWLNSMFTPYTNGLVQVDVESGQVGGHEYVIDELTSDGLLGFTNSWGPYWGARGRFYMTQPDFRLLLGLGGDATRFVPITEPAPKPIDNRTWLQKLLDYLFGWL